MHGLPPKTVTKGHGPKIIKRELESVEAQEHPPTLLGAAWCDETQDQPRAISIQ